MTDWFQPKSPKAARHKRSRWRGATDTELFTGTGSTQGCSLKGRQELQKVMTETAGRFGSFRSREAGEARAKASPGVKLVKSAY